MTDIVIKGSKHAGFIVGAEAWAPHSFWQWCGWYIVVNGVAWIAKKGTYAAKTNPRRKAGKVWKSSAEKNAKQAGSDQNYVGPEFDEQAPDDSACS